MRGDRLKQLRKEKNLNQQQLAEILGVDRTMVGKYEIKNNRPSAAVLDKMSEYFQVSKSYLLGFDTPNNTGIRIPVLGRVVAGVPIEAITEILDYEEIPETMASQGEYFGLVAQGNSMAPTIIEGDVLIIRKQPCVENGKAAIVLVNGNEATVKRVHVTETSLTLIADNPVVFPPKTYTREEALALPIIVLGVVVEIRRKMV